MLPYTPPTSPRLAPHVPLEDYSSSPSSGCFTPSHLSSFSPSRPPRPRTPVPILYNHQHDLVLLPPRPSSPTPSSLTHLPDPRLRLSALRLGQELPFKPPSPARPLQDTSTAACTRRTSPTALRAAPPTSTPAHPPPLASTSSSTSTGRVSTAEGQSAMVAEEREGVRTPETAVQEEGDVEMGDWGGDSAGRNSGAEGRDRSAGDGEGYGPSAPKRRKLDGDDASETEEGEQASATSPRQSSTEGDGASRNPPRLRPVDVPPLRPPAPSSRRSFTIEIEEDEDDEPYVFTQADLPEDAPRVDPRSSAFDIPPRPAGQTKSKKRRIIIFIWWDSKTRTWRIIVRVLPFVRRWMEWTIFQETGLRPDEYELIIPIVMASATKSFDKLPVHHIPDEYSIHRLFDNDGELLRNAAYICGIGLRALGYNISAWIEQLFYYLHPELEMIFTRADKPQPIRTTPKKLGEAAGHVLTAMGLQVKEGEKLPEWDMDKVTTLRRSMEKPKYREGNVDFELFLAVEAGKQFLLRIESSDLYRSMHSNGLGRRFPTGIVTLNDFDLDGDKKEASKDQVFLVKGGPRQQPQPKLSTRPRPPRLTANPLTQVTSGALASIPRIPQKRSVGDSTSSSSTSTPTSASSPRSSSSSSIPRPRTSTATYGSSSSASTAIGSGGSARKKKARQPRAKLPEPLGDDTDWSRDWSFFDEKDIATLRTAGRGGEYSATRAAYKNDGQSKRTENAEVTRARIRQRVWALICACKAVEIGGAGDSAAMSQAVRSKPYDKNLIRWMTGYAGVRFVVRAGNSDFKKSWRQAMKAAGGWSTSELDALWKEDSNTLKWLYLALGSGLVVCEEVEYVADVMP